MAHEFRPSVPYDEVFAIEIFPLHIFPQHLTLLKKLFLRPSKLILLIHQLQKLTPCHYSSLLKTMESYVQGKPCRSLSQNSCLSSPSFSLQGRPLWNLPRNEWTHPETHSISSGPFHCWPWLLEKSSQAALTVILPFPPIGWSTLFPLPTALLHCFRLVP